MVWGRSLVDSGNLKEAEDSKEVDMENVEEAVQLAATNPREVATKRMLALAGKTEL